MEKIYKFENAKAVVNDNGVVTVVVNEIYQPKDGEIVMFQDRPDSVFIYKKVNVMNANATTYYVALCAGINLFYNDPEYHMLRGYDFTDVVPATEEAKQLLFDALESKNLMWDPDTKQVVRWRASLRCKYFYIIDYGTVNISYDTRGIIDNQRFKFGNYFATYELAKKAMENFKNSFVFAIYKNLIDLYGIEGISAAIRNYAATGTLLLNKISDISDDMIAEVIGALYDLSDDFDYQVVKDGRSKGEQFVKIRIKWGYDINFRITPQGEYSLVYFSGLGKVISNSTNFDKCLENFILRFTPILRKIKD